MEPVEKKVRYKLLITKSQVIKVEQGALGTRFYVQLPQGIILTADLTFEADVKQGDVLSIYTEIYAHAHPSTTSIQ